MTSGIVLIMIFALGLMSPVHAGSARSKKVTAADRKELARLLRPHVWRGKGVYRGVRAAAGDPRMAVIDRRNGRNFVSQCNFIIYRKKRALVCDSY